MSLEFQALEQGMSVLNPLKSILTSCSRVTDEAQSVQIDEGGIEAFVEGMKSEDIEALRNGGVGRRGLALL